MFVILVMLMRDRERERRYQERRERRTSEEHRETVRVLGVLSLRQQMIIGRLLSERAVVRKARRGGYALVKPDGNYAVLSEDEASYALDQES